MNFKNIVISGLILPISLICSLSHAAQITLQHGSSEQDTYVYSGDPNQQHGGAWEYNVSNIDSSGEEGRGLVKFNLSSIAETNASTAILSLYCTNSNTSDSSSQEVYIYRVTSSWNEFLATWNNMPSFTTQDSCSTPIDDDYSGWITWDVTDIVNKWLSGATDNYGFMIISEYNDTNVKSFSGQDFWNASWRPKLYMETIESTPIPEPFSIILLGLASLSIGLRKKI